MSSIIKIKRSITAGAPPTLGAGELAYSFAPSVTVQGGDRLYIGDGQMPVVIGGKYFTDRLNHTPGVLTASAALIVDSDKKIDDLLVDDIQINGNTVGTTTANTNLVLSPNGTGKVSIGGVYTLPKLDGNSGDALITDGQGNVSFQKVSSELRIRGDDSAEDVVSLINDTLEFLGGNAISTVVTDGTVLITVSDASSSQKGVAQFSAAYFTVTDGDVSIASASDTALGLAQFSADYFSVTNGDVSIADATTTNKGIASFSSDNFIVDSIGEVTTKSITIGNTTFEVGDTVTTLAGIQQLDIDNIKINGNEISATDVDGGISLKTQGTGVVSVNNTRITDLTNPINPKDAVTKEYVDEVAQGLSVKPAVRAATTYSITATYDNGVLGVGSTLTIPATATLDIDGITNWSIYDGILVKNQTNKFENGRYFVSTIGNINDDWVLTRCPACDEQSEIPSAYIFVQEGSVNKATGWVAVVENFPTFAVGTDDIEWIQFSGAGSYQAGAGLGLDGSTFNVLVDANGGIEIVSDNLQLKSTLAGDGLSYTTGVLSVGGTTDRISVDADSIDIAATYVGQSSITTLGTIATGVWQGTTVGTAYGGTGLNSFSLGDLVVGTSQGGLTTLAIGTAGKFLQVNTAGDALLYGDIDGGTY
jgi:hypothetical protein